MSYISFILYSIGDGKGLQALGIIYSSTLATTLIVAKVGVNCASSSV